MKSASVTKNRPGRRISSSASFLKSLVAMMGIEQVAAHVGKTKGDVEAVIKHAAAMRRQIWSDADNDMPDCVVKHGTKSEIVKGKGRKDGMLEKTAGATIDFSCIMTSKSEDRDGDILDPSGAMLDPAMPLLFQHLPFENAGKFVKTLSNDGHRIEVQAACHSTKLGNDCAIMLEFGSLRISHGFVPTDYDARRDANGRELNGWDVKRFNVFEISLVSIPANKDAVITGSQRQKFHHPLVKGWGDYLFDNRQRLFTESALRSKSSNGGVNVVVKLNGLADVFKAMAGRKDDNDDTDNGGKPNGDGTDDGTKPPDKKPKDGEGDAGDGNTTDNNQSGQTNTPFPELVATVSGLSADASDDVPTEAKDRFTTAGNLLNALNDGINTSAANSATAAKTGDIATMIAEHANLLDAINTTLTNVCDELTRAVAVDGLSDAAKGKAQAALDQATMLRDAVTALMGDPGDAVAPLPTPNDSSGGDGDGGDDAGGAGDAGTGGGDGGDKSATLFAKFFGQVLSGNYTLNTDEKTLLRELADD